MSNTRDLFYFLYKTSIQEASTQSLLPQQDIIVNFEPAAAAAAADDVGKPKQHTLCSACIRTAPHLLPSPMKAFCSLAPGTSVECPGPHPPPPSAAAAAGQGQAPF